MTFSTPGIRRDLDPAAWRQHHFGLPADRWTALAGRCFWVAGGGTGFGRSIAGALAAAGARVIISGRRQKKLVEAIGDIGRLGIDSTAMIPMPVDITDPAQVTAAAADISRQCGAIYGLVHCAAVPQPAAGPWPLMDMEPEQWNRLLRTNVTGAWLVARAALSLMATRGGRVVFLTSEAGWAATPGFGAYNVSKSGLNTLGASFAAECAARYPAADLQINVLVPGEALTEMNQGSTVSPWTVVGSALLLLSHPAGGPTGCFFHSDGRHLGFAYAAPYRRSLIDPEATVDSRGADAPPPQLIASVNGHNIVRFQGLFYAIPQSLGELDLREALDAGVPGIVCWPSLATARKAVTPASWLTRMVRRMR